MSNEQSLTPLKEYLRKVPSFTGAIGSGFWWVKITIDLDHPLAWSVVQEFGHAGHLSLDERLPTVFMPVSPPPYLNGGPGEYLSWVIESKVIESNQKSFTPAQCAQWREGLPRPVGHPAQWVNE